MWFFSQKVTDPICGMKISKDQAKFSISKEGTDYYFCSDKCLKSFKEKDDKDASAEKKSDPETFGDSKDEGCCH